MKEDSTEDQMKLAGKRRYIAIYNKKREELDLKKSIGKLKPFAKFSGNTATLNEKRVDILKKLAGRFLIVTNTDIPESEIVSAYKEQWQIKRSFRTIKSFLEIRPVYHRESDRIRAHVFVGVLSLLLSRIMEKHTGRTIDSIRKGLNCLDIVLVSVGKDHLYISSESREASGILESLGLPYPRIRESAHT